MISTTVDSKKHRRIGWVLWTAQTICLFITFVIGYGPALFGCLFFGLLLGLRGDRFSDEY